MEQGAYKEYNQIEDNGLECIDHIKHWVWIGFVFEAIDVSECVYRCVSVCDFVGLMIPVKVRLV